MANKPAPALETLRISHRETSGLKKKNAMSVGDLGGPAASLLSLTSAPRQRLKSTRDFFFFFFLAKTPVSLREQGAPWARAGRPAAALGSLCPVPGRPGLDITAGGPQCVRGVSAEAQGGPVRGRTRTAAVCSLGPLCPRTPPARPPGAPGLSGGAPCAAGSPLTSPQARCRPARPPRPRQCGVAPSAAASRPHPPAVSGLLRGESAFQGTGLHVLWPVPRCPTVTSAGPAAGTGARSPRTAPWARVRRPGSGGGSRLRLLLLGCSGAEKENVVGTG